MRQREVPRGNLSHVFYIWGSRLAYTYIRKDFLDGRALHGWEKNYKQYVANKVWIFGMEPESWPDYLKEYGWNVIEDVGYDELAEKYTMQNLLAGNLLQLLLSE